MRRKVLEKRHPTIDAPLAQTLFRVAEVRIEGTDLSVCLGPQGGVGWVQASDLVGELLDGLLLRVGRRYDTDDRLIQVSLFLKSYLWRVIAPAVAAFLIDRRVPDLGADNVALDFDKDGHPKNITFLDTRFAALADDESAAHPDALALLAGEDLLAWMRDRLAEDHLPGLFAALCRSRPRRAVRALWNVAVDVCAEAFMLVGEALGCRKEACAHAGRLLGGPQPLAGETNYFMLEYAGKSRLTRVRNSCCLYHRLGDGACFTCPRTTDEERARRLSGE